jgi:tetratricopeptide (TPR) repeat protein
MSLEQLISQEHWGQATVMASNLSRLMKIAGQLHAALVQATACVDLSRRRNEASVCAGALATLGSVLHAKGQLEEAAAAFEQGERAVNVPGSHFPMLQSISGFWYCDTLLDQGKSEDVLIRARLTRVLAMEQNSRLDVALGDLSCGRAHIISAQQGSSDSVTDATSCLTAAIDILRLPGYAEYLPLGLLAGAALHTHTRAFDLARRDLEETLTLATRSGFRLHEADAHLGLTRLSLAEDDPVAAREHLDRARSIVDATGYHRRDRELAELDAACPAPLQAVDLLVILELAALGGPPAPARPVAEGIGLPESAVALSFQRLEAMGLLRQEGEHRRINKLALRQCLEHAIRWIAPAEVGGAELGLLTAHSAPPLPSKLIGDHDPMVMPLPHGPARGRAVTPLHPLAPGAAARDPKLHTLLALVDALRIGGAREREVAATELGARL